MKIKDIRIGQEMWFHAPVYTREFSGVVTVTKIFTPENPRLVRIVGEHHPIDTNNKFHREVLPSDLHPMCVQLGITREDKMKNVLFRFLAVLCVNITGIRIR